MPTLFDFLRRNLLGDEGAAYLEVCLDILCARAIGASQKKIPAGSIADEWTRPSLGYEPYLMQMGVDQPAARAFAKFAVRHGRRRVEDGKQYREVSRDIRFLAKAPRQRAAIRRCARRLQNACEMTPLVGDLLHEASVDEAEFTRLLQLVVEGGEVELCRLFQFSAAVVPHLSGRRGPKISTPSATHEFLLDHKFLVPLGAWPKGPQERAAEYVDALTAATRKEFGNSNFDPRPAQRRTRGRNKVAEE
ncbi:MAG TPA: hypothetical protein VMU69_17570 [Bradyrhizobium sp.]|nr:hypothetical protein [Bradyrhizobium sp.]